MPLAAGLYYATHEGDSFEKPPVILVHGAGSSQQSWPFLLRRLNKYRVLAPDLPGHGRSPGAGQHSAFTYADRLVNFLDEMNIYQAVFVGHCLGGAVSLALALEFPQRVAGLTLISCGAVLNTPMDICEMSRSTSGLPIAVESLAERSFSPQAPAALVSAHVQRLMETRPGVLYGDLLACNAFDVRTQLPRIHQPTLVLCGSEDRLTPPAYAHLLVDRMPAARLSLFYGAGHMLMQEQPQAVTSAVESFLEEVPYQVGQG